MKIGWWFLAGLAVGGIAWAPVLHAEWRRRGRRTTAR